MNRRDLLRVCAKAYPRAARERDGAGLIDLAQELSEGDSSVLRESAGLLRGGAAARVRRTFRDLTLVPWQDARSRLALPLATALFVLAAAGAGRAGIASAWVGWSVVATLAAAGLALAGAATGSRRLTAAGAFAVTGMLGLDALRDVYGAGSRWTTEVGSALVDMLPMWLPAGLLLVVCAGAVAPVPANAAIRRTAWALVPGVAAVILTSEPTRIVIADRILLFGGFGAAAVLAVLAVVRRRSDPVLAPIAALVVATVAVPALWLVAAFLPPPAGGMPSLAFGYFAAGALAAGASIVLLARMGRPAGR